MSRIVFGTHEITRYPFEISYDRTRTATYVVGSPDMGKSTLLGNLAEQFCAAGEGVLLLDIKGDLAKEVASRTRHPERVMYVQMGEIVFPGNERRMWTINPFDGHRDNAERRKQLSSSILESFQRMGLAQLGTMANIRGTISNAIDMAMTLADPTYLDLLLIIIDQNYRQMLLNTQRHIDHITRKHWQDLDNPKVTTTYMRRNEINTSRNRLETLLKSSDFNLPAGRYQSTLKLKEWLDKGRMILIDLGLPLERNSGIDLGNMIMAQVMTDVFMRHPSERQRTWRIIADEFHLYVGANFAEIISGARSFNVFPVVAHQDRSQLHPKEDAVLISAVGHAGISVFLKGSREDRVALASLFGMESLERFMRLKQFSALIEYHSSLTDNTDQKEIKLNKWWADPVPGQLAQLQMAAYEHTVPKRELVEHNRRRYWDYLDGGTRRDTRKDDVCPRQTQTDPPAEVRPLQGAGQSSGSGDATSQAPDTARVGVARPPRVIDQWDDSGSALPRPPTRKPKRK